jgi:hypothetical protein
MGATMRRNLSLAGLATAVALTAVPLASADTLVVGNPPNSGNCFPLGCVLWAPEYQQVYARGDFPSQLTITGLTFYNTLGGADNGFNGGTYTFALSSTSKLVDGLDLTNLANNIGADNTVVFSGTLPAGPIPVGGNQTIVFSTAFTYDPASGLNLLLDINSPAPIQVSSFFDEDLGNAGGLFSRAMTPGCCTGFSDDGLVTGFVTVPAPKLSSLPALLGVGLGSFAFAALRRRRTT